MKSAILTLSILLTLAFSATALAQTTSLNLQATWTAPTKNTDGSSLTNLASFNLYRTDSGSNVLVNSSPIPRTRGTSSSPYLFSTSVLSMATTTLTFVVTAVNTNGQESGPSNTASYVYTPTPVPPPPAETPSAPSKLLIILQP